MSAALALKAARDSGITIGTDGDDLILEACSEPPATVIDLLSRHKAEVLAILAAREHESNENKLIQRTTPRLSQSQAIPGEPGVDQPCTARRGRVQESNGVFMHFCIQCGRFGPYGYGVSLRAGQLGRWYCGDHRPQEHEKSK
jgi:hypothetical protein